MIVNKNLKVWAWESNAGPSLEDQEGEIHGNPHPDCKKEHLVLSHAWHGACTFLGCDSGYPRGTLAQSTLSNVCGADLQYVDIASYFPLGGNNILRCARCDPICACAGIPYLDVSQCTWGADCGAIDLHIGAASNLPLGVEDAFSSICVYAEEVPEYQVVAVPCSSSAELFAFGQQCISRKLGGASTGRWFCGSWAQQKGYISYFVAFIITSLSCPFCDEVCHFRVEKFHGQLFCTVFLRDSFHTITRTRISQGVEQSLGNSGCRNICHAHFHGTRQWYYWASSAQACHAHLW